MNYVFIILLGSLAFYKAHELNELQKRIVTKDAVIDLRFINTAPKSTGCKMIMDGPTADGFKVESKPKGDNLECHWFVQFKPHKVICENNK